MTALPQVEDLPQIVLAEDREDDDLVHIPCCDWREIERRGERTYALCGVDLTEHDVVTRTLAEDEWCPVCKVIDDRDCEWDRKTKACVDCPQLLFTPKEKR